MMKISFLFFCTIYIALGYELKAQKESDSTNYHYNLALNPQKSKDISTAYTFFVKQKRQSLIDNDTLSAIYNLRLLAIIQNESGFYHDSENTCVEGISLLANLPQNKFTIDARVGFYNQLGRIHRILMDYNTAIYYYNKALEITNDLNHLCKILNNRAFVYVDEIQFDLALRDLHKAYSISLEIGDNHEIARNLDNLGFVKSKLGHEDALSFMQEALSKRLILNDLQGTYASYKHLSEYYQQVGMRKEHLYYLEQALAIAKTINSDSYVSDALSSFMELSEEPKVRDYIKLANKVERDNLLSENKYASEKYDYSEFEKKALQSELEKEKQESRAIIAFSIASIIAILSIFLYIIIKSKHKKDKLRQVYQTETHISKTVHDEVANDIYHLMSKIQNSLNPDTQTLDDLELIYKRTRDIAKAHSFIDVTGNYSAVINDLLLSYKTDNIQVITKGNSAINWAVLSDDSKIVLHRVLQELMTNMRKHSKASVVVLNFKQSQKKITITYNDNGIGKRIVKSSGILNMENRMASINGSITFESKPNKGLKTILTV